jgi:hypothetical protein
MTCYADDLVSFVIPALNEAQYIGATLDSIQQAMSRGGQQHYEIIVVDDGSADDTAKIAIQHQARVLQVCQRNIAAVRNSGAREARGKFLIFVDADTEVSDALLGEAVHAMSHRMIWGTALAVPSDACPLWARLGLTVFNHYYVYRRKCAYGFFFVVNRQAFQELGGFPEMTNEGEDMALSKLLAEKHGPPRVLRSRVATSARKAAQFGFLYHLRMCWLALRFGDAIYTRPEIADYRNGEHRLHRP